MDSDFELESLDGKPVCNQCYGEYLQALEEDRGDYLYGLKLDNQADEES